MNDMELLIILLLFNALEDDTLSFLKVVATKFASVLRWNENGVLQGTKVPLRLHFHSALPKTKFLCE